MTVATTRDCLCCGQNVIMIWESKPGTRMYLENYRPRNYKTREWELICPTCGFVMQFVEGLDPSAKEPA